MDPSVSVVITCYNYGKYLKGCIESVLSQTYQDFEIIVVNDGSTDTTDEVIQPFLSAPNVKYIKQKNRGQANAKNTGIKNSKGELVAFLDADDLWESRKLEKQLPLFSDPKVGVVFSLASYIDEDGQKLGFKLTGKYLMPRSGNVTEYLFFDNFVPFSSSVVRKKCLEQVGTFNETLSMGIDWDLWLRLSVHYSFIYVDEPLLVYRLGHPGQMSKNLHERFRCADRIMQKFLEHNPDFLSALVVRRGKAYALCNRGRYFSWTDLKLSNQCFWSALRNRPFEFGAYVGLIRNFAKWGKTNRD